MDNNNHQRPYNLAKCSYLLMLTGAVFGRQTYEGYAFSITSLVFVVWLLKYGNIDGPANVKIISFFAGVAFSSMVIFAVCISVSTNLIRLLLPPSFAGVANIASCSLNAQTSIIFKTLFNMCLMLICLYTANNLSQSLNLVALIMGIVCIIVYFREFFSVSELEILHGTHEIRAVLLVSEWMLPLSHVNRLYNDVQNIGDQIFQTDDAPLM